jgi:hypothetical protein
VTVERYMVAPRAPWPVCTLCGLAAPDVRMESGELRCPDRRRCAAAAVLRHKPLIFEPRDIEEERSPTDFKGEKPPAGSWRDFLEPAPEEEPK